MNEVWEVTAETHAHLFRLVHFCRRCDICSREEPMSYNALSRRHPLGSLLAFSLRPTMEAVMGHACFLGFSELAKLSPVSPPVCNMSCPLRAACFQLGPLFGAVMGHPCFLRPPELAQLPSSVCLHAATCIAYFGWRFHLVAAPFLF